MQIDYVVLICETCGNQERHDHDPPLVGGVQLRRWFSESAKPCPCGGASWQMKAHVIGTAHVGG